ncbi:hypothetical protein [Micromonospora sp. NPDC092111]|uniref:hypothetical protein n=1 Tax=Micromonospora sp. NPDC092111 TaxID=3364289 RepID=UPI00382CD31A
MTLLTAACADSTGGGDGGRAAYPGNLKPLTISVPFGAGGTTDTIARLVAPELEKSVGVPDGSMIGFANLPSAVTTYVGNGDVSYDKRSFMPLGVLTSVSTVNAVHEDSPHENLGDLVEAARAKPGRIASATAAEQGFDLNLLSRIGTAAPAGIDDKARDVLVRALRDVAEKTTFRSAVEALGYGGGFLGPDQFGVEWTDAEDIARTVVEEEKE